VALGEWGGGGVGGWGCYAWGMAVGDGRRVLIVGAGLAGCLAACALRRLGYGVEVIEKRPDPRREGYGGGRSINLALSARGIAGLASVGLDRTVIDLDAIAMRGRMIHAASGATAYQPYSSDPGDAIYSVSRGGLNVTLIEAAEKAGAVLAFDTPCVDVDVRGGEVRFRRGGGEEFVVGADLVLGCDGAFSPVRGAMQRVERFDYQQFYLKHGYKELHIPPGKEVGVEFKRHDGWALDPHALHIWPRGTGGRNGGAMMIALPNRDKSFTCTLFWPYGGEHGFEVERSDEELRGFFARHYGDALPLMPTLVEDFRKNPVGSLVTVRCWPWVGPGGKVAILGDAAHAIVPFYGQGMNCSFQDVQCLAECLERHGGSGGAGGADARQAAALEEFQRLRKPAADAVSQLALDNFVEMRDKVGSRAFLLKKKAEQRLHGAFPEVFVPLYNLVSFTTVPYQEAVRMGRRQGQVLRGLVALPVGLVVMAVLFALGAGVVGAVVLGVLMGVVVGWWVLGRVEARFVGE
jgi:kynurenine 3-monooxygenase